jgi:dihydrodipicolinate synthase/N-acetylneuraminate lyase
MTLPPPEGIVPAPLTPMLPDHGIDWASFRRY